MCTHPISKLLSSHMWLVNDSIWDNTDTQYFQCGRTLYNEHWMKLATFGISSFRRSIVIS